MSVEADAKADEGEEVVFEVKLSKASSSDVTVEYEVVIVAGNSASPGRRRVGGGYADYSCGSDLKRTVSVATTQDAVREGPETFTLRLLSVSSNAAINAEDGTATGTIPDDEPVPAEGQIRLTLTPAEVREAAGTTTEVSVTASVDSPTDAAVTVSLVLERHGHGRHGLHGQRHAEHYHRRRGDVGQDGTNLHADQ